MCAYFFSLAVSCRTSAIAPNEIIIIADICIKTWEILTEKTFLTWTIWNNNSIKLRVSAVFILPHSFYCRKFVLKYCSRFSIAGLYLKILESRSMVAFPLQFSTESKIQTEIIHPDKVRRKVSAQTTTKYRPMNSFDRNLHKTWLRHKNNSQ